MKICFNEATTMKNSTLQKDLELCEKHGYDLIEIRLDKLKDYLTTHTVDDLARFFKNNRIKPFSFSALKSITFRDPVGHRQIKEDLKFLCEAGTKISCKKIIVVPTFDVGRKTKGEIKTESIRSLSDLADTAEKYGIKLAYEFVGYPNCSVNTFGQAYDIVSSVNRDSVGIVFDCFHFHAMNSRMENLKKADGRKIFILHLDDSEDLPPGMLRDHHRLWPGEGAINISEILKTLKKIGFNEMASIELYRPEYWDLDVEETIRIGRKKTEEAVQKYFKVE